ncbi:MAG: radical SAM protein [Microgenomates group bacterium]
MAKEVLFTLAQDLNNNSTGLEQKLTGLYNKNILQPQDAAFLNSYIGKLHTQNTDTSFSFSWEYDNLPGTWMSENITTPSKILSKPLSIEQIDEELATGKYDHVVMASYLSGFSDFRKAARHIRQNYPNITTIGASVGALVQESQIFVDHTIKGNQVDALRQIIGETTNDPLKPIFAKARSQTLFNGIKKETDYAILLSSYGCMYGCDFCPSTAQFGTEYKAPFTPQQIKDEIIKAHDTIAPNSPYFMVSLGEPQGLGNVAQWKEVFRLCQDLPFQCDLVTTTSSKVISKYTIDELTHGALRVTTVNIGVESLLNGYKKNDGTDLQKLNAHLQEHGINVVSTFIVGLDWHTQDNVRKEIQLLKGLESSGYIVANLEMQPGTPLYKQYKAEGKLIDVPPELLAFYGYQAFKHPHFASGFTDMLPLLEDINSELSDGTTIFNANATIFLKRKNSFDAPIQKDIIRQINEYKKSLHAMHPLEAIDVRVDKFAAELYYHLAFHQMDLFHPFLLSTN